MHFFIRFFYVLFNKLCRKNFDHFIHYKYKLVKKYYGEKCLDVGAGYGHFSHYLATKGHEIKAIDVTNKFQYNLDFQLFDGKHILLKDEEVSTSIIMFVLHHTDDQIELLKETARVTKDFIIIGEDIMNSGFDRVLGNIHLNTSPWAKSNNLFHSSEKWKEIFDSLDLKIVEALEIPRKIYPIYPVSRKIFVLKKKKKKSKKL